MKTSKLEGLEERLKAVAERRKEAKETSINRRIKARLKNGSLTKEDLFRGLIVVVEGSDPSIFSGYRERMQAAGLLEFDPQSVDPDAIEYYSQYIASKMSALEDADEIEFTRALLDRMGKKKPDKK